MHDLLKLEQESSFSNYTVIIFPGAMAVIDGNVVAINPADEPRTHMYIWNNIFFSLGFDVKDHYKVSSLLKVISKLQTYFFPISNKE